MKNQTSPSPIPSEPSASWQHRPLWDGVKNALMALPAHFRSDTFIEGVDATDVFTLNSALGATIEAQVVATLNAMRSVWDKNDAYRTYTFVRQPQSFPDVVLRNLADKSEQPIMGIELKGWYLLAKEGEPSLRFSQTEAACADADLIMVVPWVLSSVISGRPRIYTPFIVGAKYAAQYRNHYWKNLRGSSENTDIVIPETAAPYPKKSDKTADKPVVDGGKNFGRIARSGIMDEYLSLMAVQPVCGIKAIHWLEFFKIFHQDVTDEEVHASFERLRSKAGEIASSPLRESVMILLSDLEAHLERLA